MLPATQDGQDRRTARVREVGARICLAVAALGTLVLVLGWWLDVAALRSVMPGQAAMKPNTAAMIAAAGAAMWLELAAGPRGLMASRVLGGLVTLVAALTLVEHVSGADLGIDTLLAAVDDGSPHPGRVSIASSLALASLGLGIALGMRDGRPVRPFVWLPRLAASVALVALLGYFYGADALYRFGPYESVALHTALSIYVLGLVYVVTRGDSLSPLVTSNTAGGTMLRRLGPAAVLTPPLLGWVCLRIEAAGLIGAEVGVALFATANVLVFSYLVWSDARRLDDAERLLRQREHKLDVTLQSIGDAVIATDDRGLITRLNPVAETLTGWPVAEARGKPLAEVFRIVSEDGRAPVESPADVVLREGKVVGLANHTLLIARDGTERAIADSGAPIRSADGDVIGVVLVFRDQTEERAAQTALQATQTRMDRLSDSGLLGIVVVRRDGTIEEANDTFLQMVMRDRADLTAGRVRWQQLVSREQHPRAAPTLADLDHRGVTELREREYMRPDGSTIEVLRGAAALDKDRFIAFALDLTPLRSEQRRAQQNAERAQREEASRLKVEAALEDRDEQLRQAQKMEAIGQLAGGVAHDFNNLLSVILSYAALLEQDASSSGSQRDQAREILHAGQRAAELTKQLLAFGRRQMLQPRAVSLNETLTSMGSLLRPLLGEAIELELRCAPDVPAVLVDPGQIQQVVMNLAVNARDAMPSGGKLTLATRTATVDAAAAAAAGELAPGSYVALEVTDTGAGIAPDVLPRIFEPFFTTKPVGQGTGLGLATVFGIVKQSGGHVEAESAASGGATFRVLLPRAPARSLSPEPSRSVPTPLGGRETILLVEDHDQLRRLAHRVLERAGYTVIQAENGAVALEVAAAHTGTIDLVLTDVVMPRMGGRELVDALIAARGPTRALFVSGYTDDTVMRHGVATGSAFLQKPVAPAALLAKVRELLDAPQRAEDGRSPR